jgi:molybdopterin-guanine dinucleotide biosynthesis protein A
MGTDKAFVDLGGQPLAARILAVLRDAEAARIVAVGGDLGRLAALGFEPVADSHPGAGPLGGLADGLDALAAGGLEHAFVTACDQPALPSSMVIGLVQRATDEPTAAVVLPVVDDVVQPLAAVYRIDVRHALRDAFEAGERSVRRAIEPLAVVRVGALPSWWFVDVDTPDDLDQYAATDGST